MSNPTPSAYTTTYILHYSNTPSYTSIYNTGLHSFAADHTVGAVSKQTTSKQQHCHETATYVSYELKVKAIRGVQVDRTGDIPARIFKMRREVQLEEVTQRGLGLRMVR
jgi:hypothetical protein